MGGRELSAIVPMEQWSIWLKLQYSLLQLTSLGVEFVIFFFVLSGFSIAHSLSRNNELGAFYKKRFIRLYPPYILALIWAAFVFGLLKDVDIPLLAGDQYSVFHTWGTVFKNILYIPDGSLITQFWSLSHEVIFYLVIPFLIIRSPWKVYLYSSILIHIVSVILQWNGRTGESIPAQFILDYNIYFVIGIFLYKHFDRVKKWVTVSKWSMVLVAAFVFCLMAGIKFFLQEHNKITLFMSALLSVFLVVNFLHHQISNKLLRYLGAMSYSIYIFHFATLYFFVYLLDKVNFSLSQIRQSPFMWLVAVVFCLLIITPLYYIAEYPTKQLLTKLRGKKKIVVQEEPAIG